MRRLLLAKDENDAHGWLRRRARYSPDFIMCIWPGLIARSLAGLEKYPFDRLSVTAAASSMDAHIAACLTRVKGPDGLTPGQRITADEAGTRLRGAS